MDDKILQIITCDVMQQYEEVRQSGLCNMFNTDCVIRAAMDLDFSALAAVYGKHYSLIWQNFNSLMQYYGIAQEGQ